MDTLLGKTKPKPQETEIAGRIAPQFRIGLIQYGTVNLQTSLQRHVLPAFVSSVLRRSSV
jgi:hypothetical protein